MRWGRETEWRISDGFSEWRFWIAPIGQGHVSRGELTEDPLFHIIYRAFNHSWAKEDRLASDLIAMYDALTGSRLGDKLPRPTRDRQRLLRGFDAELSRVLYSAIEAGILKYERYEVPWPFPEKEEKPPSKRDLGPQQKEEKFSIRVLNEDGHPMGGAIVRVIGEGISQVERTADSGGWVEITVSAMPLSCVVQWRAPSEKDFQYERALSLFLGDDPDSDHRRLGHLGYDAESPGERVGQYKRDFGHERKAKLSDIRGELAGWHDGGDKPKAKKR